MKIGVARSVGIGAIEKCKSFRNATVIRTAVREGDAVDDNLAVRLYTNLHRHVPDSVVELRVEGDAEVREVSIEIRRGESRIVAAIGVQTPSIIGIGPVNKSEAAEQHFSIRLRFNG